MYLLLFIVTKIYININFFFEEFFVSFCIQKRIHKTLQIFSKNVFKKVMVTTLLTKKIKSNHYAQKPFATKIYQKVF